MAAKLHFALRTDGGSAQPDSRQHCTRSCGSHHGRQLVVGKRRGRPRAQVELAAQRLVDVHAHVGDRRVVAVARLRGRIDGRLERVAAARAERLRPHNRLGKVLPGALVAAGDCMAAIGDRWWGGVEINELVIFCCVIFGVVAVVQ